MVIICWFSLYILWLESIVCSFLLHNFSWYVACGIFFCISFLKILSNTFIGNECSVRKKSIERVSYTQLYYVHPTQNPTAWCPSNKNPKGLPYSLLHKAHRLPLANGWRFPHLPSMTGRYHLYKRRKMCIRDRSNHILKFFHLSFLLLNKHEHFLFYK